MSHLIVVGFGPVATHKYVRFIAEAIRAGSIESYSIVDLASKKQEIDDRLVSLEVQPTQIRLLPDAQLLDLDRHVSVNFGGFVRDLRAESPDLELKVLISTEPRAHESYIRYCISIGLDTLTTKPLLVPTVGGRFEVSGLCATTRDLALKARLQGGNHAVLCLGRHHEVFDNLVRRRALEVVERLAAPITSLHVRTASGVWNLQSEYESREDHPYKYGYGMLMHGAYHYVDLLARALLANRRVFRSEELFLRLSAISAGPADQYVRVPPDLEVRLTEPKASLDPLSADLVYGETDIVGSFGLTIGAKGPCIAVGTFGLEQTTPGMRSWGEFPMVPYNINGRLHVTDVDLRVGVAYGVSARVTKVPIGARCSQFDVRTKNVALIAERSNAGLTGSQEFLQEHHLHRPYGDSFSFRAERTIFMRWISGQDTISTLDSHIPTAALLEAIGQSMAEDGRLVQVPLQYAEPSWPE